MKSLFAGLQSKKEISISKKEEICSTLNSLIFHEFPSRCTEGEKNSHD
jgi:hypothetical protein